MSAVALTPARPVVDGSWTWSPVLRGSYPYRGWYIAVYVDGSRAGDVPVADDGTYEYDLSAAAPGRRSVSVCAYPPSAFHARSPLTDPVSVQVGDETVSDGAWVVDSVTNRSSQTLPVSYSYRDTSLTVFVPSGNAHRLPGGVVAADLLPDTLVLVSRGDLYIQRHRYGDSALSDLQGAAVLSGVPRVEVSAYDRYLVPGRLFGSNGNTGGGVPTVMWTDAVALRGINFSDIQSFETGVAAPGFPCVGPVGSSTVCDLPTLPPHPVIGNPSAGMVVYDTPTVREHFAHAVIRVGVQWYVAASASAFRLRSRPHIGNGGNLYGRSGEWPRFNVFSAAVHGGSGGILWNRADFLPGDDSNPTHLSVDTSVSYAATQIPDGPVTAVGVYLPTPFAPSSFIDTGYNASTFSLDYLYLYNHSGVRVYQDDIYTVGSVSDAGGEGSLAGDDTFLRLDALRPSYEVARSSWRISCRGYSVYTTAAVMSDGVVTDASGAVDGAAHAMDPAILEGDPRIHGVRIERLGGDISAKLQLVVTVSRPDLLTIDGVAGVTKPAPILTVPAGARMSWTSVAVVAPGEFDAVVTVSLAPLDPALCHGCAFDVHIKGGVFAGIDNVRQVVGAGLPAAGVIGITSPVASSLSSSTVTQTARVGTPYVYTVTTDAPVGADAVYGFAPRPEGSDFSQDTGVFSWTPVTCAFASESGAGTPGYVVPFFCSATVGGATAYARVNLQVLPQHQINVDGASVFGGTASASSFRVLLLTTSASSAAVPAAPWPVDVPWEYTFRYTNTSGTDWAALTVTTEEVPTVGSGTPMGGVRGMAVVLRPAGTVELYWSTGGPLAGPPVASAPVTFSVRMRVRVTYDGSTVRVYIHGGLVLSVVADLSLLGASAYFGFAAVQATSGGRASFDAAAYNPRLPPVP